MFPYRRIGAERIAGLTAVVALHAVVFYGLWSHRILVMPDEVVTLFVETIATPPAPKEPPKPARLDRPRPVEKSQPQQLVANAAAVSPAEPVAPPPPPAPAIEAPPARPAGPVALGSELAVACPERSAPAYPPLSRRLGEEGKVVLRVELDEQGSVSAARVATASGFPRLDEAALAAVKTWRCNPARRDGQPVRAVALQPFKFVLQ
ncbi:MAG: energy transducer TonB [Rhodocyclales bacterium]|nr:energy transducer TonB [Rhodocyclales bacterium]